MNEINISNKNMFVDRLEIGEFKWERELANETSQRESKKAFDWKCLDFNFMIIRSKSIPRWWIAAEGLAEWDHNILEH